MRDIWGEAAPVIPFSCPAIGHEPEPFPHLRSQAGPVRVVTRTGASAWLVTRLADVKALSAGWLLGKSHPDPSTAPRLWDAEMLKPGDYFDREQEVHRRRRRVFGPPVSARGVRALGPKLLAILDDLLGKFEADGPPSDLVSAVARPFALRSLFAAYDIPEELTEPFVAWSDAVRRTDTARAQNTLRVLEVSLRSSRMLAAVPAAYEDEQDQYIYELSQTLLAGYDTSAGRLAHAVAFMLTHQAQLERLKKGEVPARQAAEETLRMAVPGGSWMPRHAREDFEYHGTAISAGDLVVLALQAANRDEDACPSPGVFDIGRSHSEAVPFGIGKFRCLGAELAKAQIEMLLKTLWQRLPALHLAVDPAELREDASSVTGGLEQLPVAW